MKVGLIVHSKTGNTYGVAKKLQQKLQSLGHITSLEKVIAKKDDEIKVANVRFTSNPSIENYDLLILAAPVWAFNLSSIMIAYLSQINTNSSNIKALCFVTQSLPFSWMGGNRALKKMRQLCQDKGIEVLDTKVIHWSSKQRSIHIEEMISNFTDVIKSI